MFITPLTIACFNDHLDVVKYFEETHQAVANLPGRGEGYSPLTMAFYFGPKLTANFLLIEVHKHFVKMSDDADNTAVYYVI